MRNMRFGPTGGASRWGRSARGAGTAERESTSSMRACQRRSTGAAADRRVSLNRHHRIASRYADESHPDGRRRAVAPGPKDVIAGRIDLSRRTVMGASHAHERMLEVMDQAGHICTRESATERFQPARAPREARSFVAVCGCRLDSWSPRPFGLPALLTIADFGLGDHWLHWAREHALLVDPAGPVELRGWHLKPFALLRSPWRDSL